MPRITRSPLLCDCRTRTYDRHIRRLCQTLRHARCLRLFELTASPDVIPVIAPGAFVCITLTTYVGRQLLHPEEYWLYHHRQLSSNYANWKAISSAPYPEQLQAVALVLAFGEDPWRVVSAAIMNDNVGVLRLVRKHLRDLDQTLQEAATLESLLVLATKEGSPRAMRLIRRWGARDFQKSLELANVGFAYNNKGTGTALLRKWIQRRDRRVGKAAGYCRIV